MRRGVVVSGILVAGAGLALVFVLGRGIEKRRDDAWQEVATRLHGTFHRMQACSALDRFGTPAPWEQWSADGELQCLRMIEGSDGGMPWALVQVRYSVRERRGEEHPDTWHEVTVAAVQRRVATSSQTLLPATAAGDHVAAQNGRSWFVWKMGTPGAGASLSPGELPALLDEALRTERGAS